MKSKRYTNAEIDGLLDGITPGNRTPHRYAEDILGQGPVPVRITTEWREGNARHVSFTAVYDAKNQPNYANACFDAAAPDIIRQLRADLDLANNALQKIAIGKIADGKRVYCSLKANHSGRHSCAAGTWPRKKKAKK